MRKTELIATLNEIDEEYTTRLGLGAFDANAETINFALWVIKELIAHAIEKENQISRLEKQRRQGKKSAKKAKKARS